MTYHTSWVKWLRGVGLIAALLLLPSLASAREGWRGWCEIGNQSVITSGISSTTKVERSFPQCNVTVFVHGSGLATIYADNNGTVKANPFTANLDGSWIFYANDGRYDIQTSGANFPTPFTYLDVLLCDPFVAGAVCAGGTGSAHNLLSTTHLDTVPFSPPVQGDIITAQNIASPSGVNPAWARLPIGTVGQVLTSTGIDAVWSPPPASSGNIVINGSTCTIGSTCNTGHHGLEFTIYNGGTALNSGTTVASYALMATIPFACTITRYSLAADQGTATVKFWKVATGTAIPVVGNSINTSGVSLSTGTKVDSTNLSDFTTTSIALNDSIIMDITAVAGGMTYLDGVLGCSEPAS